MPGRPEGMSTLPARLAPTTPDGFTARTVRQTWHVPHPRDAVWAWLTDPATFVDGQIPPYRVEFVAPSGRDGGFGEGVWTAHHGPGLLAAGRLGEHVAPGPGRTAYRDLVYGYGSYVGSLRLARPTRLQVWADADGDDATEVRLQFDADVRDGLGLAWDALMQTFWSGFGAALTTQVAARIEGAPPTTWRGPAVRALAGAALATGLVLGLRR